MLPRTPGWVIDYKDSKHLLRRTAAEVCRISGKRNRQSAMAGALQENSWEYHKHFCEATLETAVDWSEAAKPRGAQPDKVLLLLCQ